MPHRFGVLHIPEGCYVTFKEPIEWTPADRRSADGWIPDMQTNGNTNPDRAGTQSRGNIPNGAGNHRCSNDG